MIRFKLNTPFALYAYWVVIIFWQTVRPVANRSFADVLVKIGCFAALCIYGYNRQNLANTKKIAALAAVFFLSQAVTYAFDSITAASLITGVFMVMQIVVFLFFLRNATVSAEELGEFGKWTIVSAMIMCVYNVLFNTNRFLRLFTASLGAYGSECKSFLYSNHEFAVYIVTAMICMVWSLINKPQKKFWPSVMLAFMMLNLLSTYSRTAILGGIAAIGILFFYYNKRYFWGFCGIAMVFAVALNLSDKLSDFVFDKIFKGSFDGTGGLVDDGRASMYEEEVRFFLSGDFWERLFGRGYVGGAAGGHNAYLYILNIGGIVMFSFFVLVILWGFCNSFRCIRLDRSVGSLCLGFQVFACLYMAAQTPILFFSTMDSYFITMIAVLLPLYCLNAQREKQRREKEAAQGVRWIV